MDEDPIPKMLMFDDRHCSLVYLLEDEPFENISRKNKFSEKISDLEKKIVEKVDSSTFDTDSVQIVKSWKHKSKPILKEMWKIGFSQRQFYRNTIDAIYRMHDLDDLMRFFDDHYVQDIFGNGFTRNKFFPGGNLFNGDGFGNFESVSVDVFSREAKWQGRCVSDEQNFHHPDKYKFYFERFFG